MIHDININTQERLGWTSASNAEADELCPGRHLKQKQLPEEKRSKDAEFGERVHKALASLDPSGLNYEERKVFDESRNIELWVIARVFGQAMPDKPFVWQEVRFWLEVNSFKHSGQPDFVMRWGTKALILERKSLWNEVASAPTNKQLRDQAVLVFHNVPLLTEIAVAVVQPRVTLKPEICVYTKEDIWQADRHLQRRVTASNDPKSPRIAGEIQCKHCRAKLICAEYQQWAGSQLPVAADGLLRVPVAAWTPEQRAMFCERLPIALAWLEQSKAAIKQMLKDDPNSVPGWGLKNTGNVDRITNPQEVFNRFVAQGGTVKQFMVCVGIGKGKLEEALQTVTQLKGKALDVKMNQLLDGLIDSKPKEKSLTKLK